MVHFLTCVGKSLSGDNRYSFRYNKIIDFYDRRQKFI